MAKLAIKKASTDVTVYLFIQASNVTTGAGLTGLTFETADLVASYVRPGAARAAITLATLAAADSAHSDGGFKEVDATNMPGIYRLDLPDAVCATGVNSVVVMLKGAANMAPVVLEVQLVSYDPNDAVRLGITALPNAAADAAGGLPISDAGGLDLDAQIKTDIDAILADTNELQTDDIPSTLSALDGKIDTIDGIVDDILADTNELQTDIVNGGRIDLLIDAIKSVLDNIHDTDLPAVKTETAAILEDTGTTLDGKLDTIDGIVDDILTDTGTTLHARLVLVEQILRNKLITDPLTGVMTLYDDSGNVLLTANVYQNAAGTIAYQGQGAERRERLE